MLDFQELNHYIKTIAISKLAQNQLEKTWKYLEGGNKKRNLFCQQNDSSFFHDFKMKKLKMCCIMLQKKKRTQHPMT